MIQVSGQQTVQVFFCARLELQVYKHSFQYSSTVAWIIVVICIAFEEQWKQFWSQVLGMAEESILLDGAYS